MEMGEPEKRWGEYTGIKRTRRYDGARIEKK